MVWAEVLWWDNFRRVEGEKLSGGVMAVLGLDKSMSLGRLKPAVSDKSDRRRTTV